MKVHFKYLFLLITLVALSCSKETNDSKVCGDSVIIEDYDSGNFPDTEMRVQSMEIQGDCLAITYASGGCDGDTWTSNVYSKVGYSKTIPPERYAIFELIDLEECEAFITKTTEFDLSTMQIEGEQTIRIIFDNYEEVLTYTY